MDAKTLPVRPSKAPNLPIAPVEYDQRFQEQYSNTLRLYFAQIDNLAAGYATGDFGRSIKFPHIAAQYNGVQYATADDTPTLVKWDTLDSGYGFTLNTVSGYAVPEYDGVYKIDYSLQFANTDNAQHYAVVWLRIDGVDLPGSTSKFSLGPRQTSTIYTYTVAYSSVTFKIYAGQTIELMWGTDQAYVDGVAAGVYMFYEPAQTTPMPYPFVPSSIGSITFVSALYE